MKWFKHDTNAFLDMKLQTIIQKYGMEGYGLYWFCLEHIAQKVEKHNLRFTLEYDATTISRLTNTRKELIQNILSDFVTLGLFDRYGSYIVCKKMISRTDEYTQKLINEVTKNGGNIIDIELYRDVVPTISDSLPEKVRINRIEEKRREERVGTLTHENNNFKLEMENPTLSNKSVGFKRPTLDEVKQYCKSENISINPDHFYDFYESNGWKVGKNPMKNWHAALRRWEREQITPKEQKRSDWDNAI